MVIEILGISGSPIPNSNTDRAVKTILTSSKLNSEFVKLSDLHIRPCLACKECVTDNICKQPDDFPTLAEKVLKAKALVIGAYTPYGMVDGFTKAFLERLWSMRHVKNLNRGKPVALVVTGLNPEYTRLRKLGRILFRHLLKKHLPLNQVARSITRELRMERMNLLGTVKIPGNVPCLTCGYGNTCQMSGARILYGTSTKFSSELCAAIENRSEIMKQLQILGNKIAETVNLSDTKSST